MKLRLRKGVSMVEVENGIALLDEDGGDYWELNPTGAEVLRTVLAGGDPDDAAKALVESYSVSPELARQDTADLIAQLRAARLVDEVSDEPE